jgi:uncharacterized lipoprotein YajG
MKNSIKVSLGLLAFIALTGCSQQQAKETFPPPQPEPEAARAAGEARAKNAASQARAANAAQSQADRLKAGHVGE